jgi:hypothetical protein
VIALKNKKPSAKRAGTTSLSLRTAAWRFASETSDTPPRAPIADNSRFCNCLSLITEQAPEFRSKPMASKDYKEYKEKKVPKPKRGRLGIGVTAVVLIALMVGALYYYDTRGVPSNTVYCGVFQYIELPAKTVSGAVTSNVTETMTTAVSYTTTTSVTAHVGHTTSNLTSTTNAVGDKAGVETICKYISNISNSSSSS